MTLPSASAVLRVDLTNVSMLTTKMMSIVNKASDKLRIQGQHDSIVILGMLS